MKHCVKNDDNLNRRRKGGQETFLTSNYCQLKIRTLIAHSIYLTKDSKVSKVPWLRVAGVRDRARQETSLPTQYWSMVLVSMIAWDIEVFRPFVTIRLDHFHSTLDDLSLAICLPGPGSSLRYSSYQVHPKISHHFLLQGLTIGSIKLGGCLSEVFSVLFGVTKVPFLAHCSL